jgi:hypothetical protein
MKKTNLQKFRNTLLIAFCGVLALSSVFMTIEAATSGAEVVRIEKTQAAISDENRALEETLVKSLSLAELEEKSTELGFVKADNLVYITLQESVAKLP